MEIIDLKQNSDEWHDFRKNHIGASEAPIILGVSPYKTPWGLLQEKLGAKQNTISDYILKKGHEMEERARHLFELALNTSLTPLVARSTKWPFLTASLDGMTEDRVVWEHKLVGQEDFANIKAGNIPAKFWPQLQHQMLVTGSSKAILAASYDPPEGYQYTSLVVSSDIEYQVNTLLPSLIQFWDAMNGKAEIEPGEKDCVDFSDNQELVSLLSQYEEASKLADGYQAQVKALSDSIFKLVPARGICNGVKITKSVGKEKTVVDYERMVFDLKLDTTNWQIKKKGNSSRRITFPKGVEA